MNKLNFLAITILSFILTSCNDPQNRDVWIVGTSADNPPYEFMQDGKMAGFDIDLINAIGDHLGKTMEIRNMDFHGLLAAVAVENVDMVIAGLSITSQREKRVKFSKPYTNAHIAILFRAQDKITKPEFLTGTIVGSQMGTTWTFIAKEMSEQHNFETINLSSNLMLVEELKNKRIDAVVLEKSQAEKFSSVHKDLSSISVDEYHTSFAIAYPKRAPVRIEIDEAIEELKKNGTIERLAKKWGVAGAN